MVTSLKLLEFHLKQLAAGVNGEEDGFKLWQSLVRQTELTAQLCSIMRDVRNVRGGTQKKIEKLRQLLSGLLSELTYFEEVFFLFHVSYLLVFHYMLTIRCCIALKLSILLSCSKLCASLAYSR